MIQANETKNNAGREHQFFIVLCLLLLNLIIMRDPTKYKFADFRVLIAYITCNCPLQILDLHTFLVLWTWYISRALKYKKVKVYSGLGDGQIFRMEDQIFIYYLVRISVYFLCWLFCIDFWYKYCKIQVTIWMSYMKDIENFELPNHEIFTIISNVAGVMKMGSSKCLWTAK